MPYTCPVKLTTSMIDGNTTCLGYLVDNVLNLFGNIFGGLLTFGNTMGILLGVTFVIGLILVMTGKIRINNVMGGFK